MKTIRGNKMEKQIGKKCSLILLVTLTAILFGLFSGFAFRPANAAVIQFYEDQITSNPASQENPDIYGDIIVYQDNRNGNWDIYMVKYGYPETRITTNTANQINPRIYGDKIVYQDDRNGSWDIYLYDLTARTETQITNNASSQEYPAIDGNRIVWQDNRNGNWDIYMYDLSINTERRVTTSGSNLDPSISGNRIAYIKDGNVYYFDLSSGNEVGLTTSCSNVISCHPARQNPGSTAISGSHIVWDVEIAHFLPPPNDFFYEWERDVYMIDVLTGTAWDTTSIPYDYVSPSRECPHISELQTGVYYIVYQKDAESGWGNFNIYLYRTDWQTEYRVTNSGTATQLNPRVSGGRIVYMDNRNGNWDIYMTMVGYVPEPPPGPHPPPTPAAAIQHVEAIESIIADPAQIPTSDIDGAGSKVKENRRGALLNKLDAVIASIQAGADSTDPASRTANYQSAIDQLTSISDKTDGCALRGTPDTKRTGFTPDWIITCGSQELMDPLLRKSIIILQALLD